MTTKRIIAGLPARAIRALLVFVVATGGAGAVYPQTAPEGMPARDSHQGVVVAADPYTDATRSKEKFGKKHPQEAGILALEVALRNNTDKPISMSLDRIQLTIELPGERRQQIDSLTLDETADRIVGLQAPGSGKPRFPIPGTQKKGGRGKDWQKLRDSLEHATLASDVLGPHSTVRGFVYFDINRHFEWLSHASLYVPGLIFIPSREELMFFEVDLAPAVKQ